MNVVKRLSKIFSPAKMHVTCNLLLMAIQRFDGLTGQYATGSRAGDFLAKAADKAAEIACGLYRDYPNFATGGGIDPFNTYPRQAAKQVWDSLCGSRSTLPPPANVPFTGGQCSCLTYNVNMTQKNEFNQTIPFTLFSIPGKIRGVRQTAFIEGSQTFYKWELIAGDTGCPGNVVLASKVSELISYSVTSVVRSNGAADTCGNQPARYPDRTPPDSRIYGNTSITYNDGTDFAIPFFYVPVSIQPTFSPNIRIDLGGFSFNFDLGGVDVNFPDRQPDTKNLPPPTGYPPAPPTGNPPPSFDPNRPPPDNGGGNKAPCPECPECPSVPQPPDPPGEGDPPEEKPPEEGEEVTKPGITFLEVVLTKLPDKMHYGNEGANVVFAGWVAFRSKSNAYYPREQINFQRSVFVAPPGAEGYTYTFTNGAQGYVREY